MTANHDYLEHLLGEHAAAKECGLLGDGPTLADRSRLAEEIARTPRVLKSPAKPGVARQCLRLAWPLGAAAAVIALAAGLLTLQDRSGGPQRPGTSALVELLPMPHVEQRDEFLNGRGRLVATTQATRYTLVDGLRGRVRLDQGELFVELPEGVDLEANIETPAGTASVQGTTFYVHYDAAPVSPKYPFLTVAVVGGFVEVRNPHGRALAGAGEVVLAEQGSAPRRHSGAPVLAMPPAREREWWRFGNVLGVLHRPAVQAELKLTEEQKAQLTKPAGSDRGEIGQFFRDLYTLPLEQRSKKAAEFRGVQEKQIALVLDPEQQRRLGQVLLQQQGYAALAQKEIADLLALTEEQRRQVETITRESAQVHKSAFGPGRFGPDFGKRMEELRQKDSEKLAALLTDEQKEQWRAMVGAAFDLERRTGDWRDWWDFSGSGSWDPGFWGDWRGPDNWRGPWGPGGWRGPKDFPGKPGPKR